MNQGIMAERPASPRCLTRRASRTRILHHAPASTRVLLAARQSDPPRPGPHPSAISRSTAGRARPHSDESKRGLSAHSQTQP